MDYGGINKGDTIIIQEDAKFNEEDVIMYESDHGFLIGQLVGKSIVHKSYEIRHVAHLADVTVVGKVVQCIKNY